MHIIIGKVAAAAIMLVFSLDMSTVVMPDGHTGVFVRPMSHSFAMRPQGPLELVVGL